MPVSGTERKSQALWDTLRSGYRSWTTADIAEETDSSLVYARKCLRVWALAGYLTASRRGEGGNEVEYTFTEGPALAPSILRDETAVDCSPGMTASELAALRRRLGMSLAQMAEAIGWQKTSARSIQRMEKGSKSIRPDLAEKFRALNNHV